MKAVEDYAMRLSKVIVYRNHINECEFPNEMNKILDNYLKSGDKELEFVIEDQYNIEVIKEASFRAGYMYFDMNSPIGKLRQLCLANGINWHFAKFCMVVLIVVFVVFLNGNFRYQYKIQKQGAYQTQVIKIDKLTGKSTISYPSSEK